MTIRQARFIARNIKHFVEQNFPWWDVDRVPTIKELVQDLKTNPKIIYEEIGEWHDEFYKANGGNCAQTIDLMLILAYIEEPDSVGIYDHYMTTEGK